jgi:hypothetical protein
MPATAVLTNSMASNKPTKHKMRCRRITEVLVFSYGRATFITQGMQDLITEGIARLAGASSQAVFHLKQDSRYP